MVVVSSRYQLHEHVLSKHPQDEQVDALSPRLGGSTVGTVMDVEDEADSTLVGTDVEFGSTPKQEDEDEEGRGRGDSTLLSAPT